MKIIKIYTKYNYKFTFPVEDSDISSLLENFKANDYYLEFDDLIIERESIYAIQIQHDYGNPITP